jgi:hypothetical protein
MTMIASTDISPQPTSGRQRNTPEGMLFVTAVPRPKYDSAFFYFCLGERQKMSTIDNLGRMAGVGPAVSQIVSMLFVICAVGCSVLIFMNGFTFGGMMQWYFNEATQAIDTHPAVLAICPDAVCINGYVLVWTGECFICTPYVTPNASNPWCPSQPNDAGVWYASRYNTSASCYDLEDSAFENAASDVSTLASNLVSTGFILSVTNVTSYSTFTSINESCARVNETAAVITVLDADYSVLDASISNTTAWIAALDTATNVTLTDAGPPLFVVNPSPDTQLKSLASTTTVSLSSNGTTIIVVNMLNGSAADATLDSVGGGLSLVSNSSGPDLGLWNVAPADASISVTSDASNIIIDATTTSVSSVGAGTSIIFPTNGVRGIVGGQQVTSTLVGDTIELDTEFKGDAFSLSGPLVVDDVGGDFTTRGISAGQNVTLSSSTDEIDIFTPNDGRPSTLTSAGGVNIVSNGDSPTFQLFMTQVYPWAQVIDNGTSLTIGQEPKIACVQTAVNPTVVSTVPSDASVSTSLGWRRRCYPDGRTADSVRTTVEVYFLAQWNSECFFPEPCVDVADFKVSLPCTALIMGDPVPRYIVGTAITPLLNDVDNGYVEIDTLDNTAHVVAKIEPFGEDERIIAQFKFECFA